MSLLETLQTLLDQGEIIKMEECLKANKDWNRDTLGAYLAVTIFREEIELGEETTVFDYSLDLREVIAHIYRTKLLMRRFEFLEDIEVSKDAYQYMLDTGVTNTMMIRLFNKNLFYKKRFAERFSYISKLVEGENCLRGLVFEELANQLQEETYE